MCTLISGVARRPPAVLALLFFSYTLTNPHFRSLVAPAVVDIHYQTRIRHLNSDKL